MKLAILFLLYMPFFAVAQNYKANVGSVKNLIGIESYNITFEYAEELQVPNYESEKVFLKEQFEKREKVKAGSGERFQKEWFDNRKKFYEPDFIAGFNGFELKKRKIKLVKDEGPKYTMLIKVFLIYPGYDVTIYFEHTKLEVTMTIYETENPSQVLYTSEIIHAEGRGGADDKTRITTAYENLGTQISKFLHRKS